MAEFPQTYVEDMEQLAAAVKACESVPVIAIDTEFARFNTYYPIVGLVQIFNGEHCYLIDPIAVSDMTPLRALLSNQSVLKIFHAGSEDMEVFQYELGVLPTPVFDTQIAAAALGVGFSMGYQALVEHYLDISLPKDQTRSDWLARPLSQNQLNYAALDVIHLHEVFHQQMQALRGSEKLEWVEAESSLLCEDIPTITPPEEFYKKVKGLAQLNRNQLNQLRALCAWRESKAREQNQPRNRVVDQKSLMAIVKDDLNNKHAFQYEASLSPKQVRRYGDEILFVKTQASQASDDDCPPLVERKEAPVSSKKLNLLRKVVADEADRLSVAPELLIKRRHLEKLIRSEDADGRYHLPGELAGWRANVIGDALLSALVEA